MRLQHDNAKPHTARATTNHLEERNIRILRQPPYCYIFPRLECQRDHFESKEDMENFLSESMPFFTGERMKKSLLELIRKLHSICLLYTSPSPRDGLLSRMPSSA